VYKQVKVWPVLALIFLTASPAFSDYVLVLKNGRHIRVQSYREEGSAIKFRGLGGEVGIGKDQIESIEKTGETGGAGSDAAALSPNQQPSPDERATAARPDEKPLSAEEERAKEEREYQQKLGEISQQLKETRDYYSQALRGTTSLDPSLLTSEEEIKKLNDDAAARRLDAQANPVDPGVLKLQTPSPFSSLPPVTIEESARRPLQSQQRDFSTPAANDVTVAAPPQPMVEGAPLNYTDRQRELSDLRNQALQLEKERQKLIDEMKQKNFSTGTLFLE
jgi:hypothetical protein